MEQTERGRACRAVVLLACLACPAAGVAEPLSFFGGRVRLGGELSGTLAPEDEGYFNQGSYDRNSLRQFRADLLGELRLSRQVALLAELRSDNLDAPRLYAAYLRLHPFAARAIDVQAGLVPPVFGAYPRRRYDDSPLPSLPLAFQYLTSLRADAVPENAEQLLAQRGRGWQVRYPVGSSEPGPGVPLVDAERWDAGLEAQVAHGPLSLAVAVTQGSLGHPRVSDDNGGKQVSLRVAFAPAPAFTLGVSGASGDFLTREATDALPPGSGASYRQQALGADLELAGGPWIARAEAVWSRFELPPLRATRIEDPLDALGVYAEVRYKLRPGLYLAGRAEHLGFSELDSARGRLSWDAPVRRFEAGAGWRIRRSLLAKLAWQHNRRDGGFVRGNDLLAVQVRCWF